MRVLVTGGAGFIGSHYVRTLLSGGYPGYAGRPGHRLRQAHLRGQPREPRPGADSPRYTFVQGDICDPAQLAEVLPGHDAVINFAAESHVDRSIAGAAEFVTSNVVGVQMLLDACRDGRHPAHRARLDRRGLRLDRRRRVDRESPLDPNSPYSAAKAGGDLIALAYARTHGVNVSITRCCNNYGPYQYPEKVIPLFATNLLDGKPVPLYGDGLNVRGWIHVDDHCRGIQLVLDGARPGKVYNINGDVELSNRELTGRSWTSSARPGMTSCRSTDRKGHDRRYCLDDSLLRSMGYAPLTPFSDGLKATIEWYAAQPRLVGAAAPPGAARPARSRIARG